MASQLNYFAVRDRQVELARQAERVRQTRDGSVPERRRRNRRLVGRLFLTLRLRRPAPASPPCQ